MLPRKADLRSLLPLCNCRKLFLELDETFEHSACLSCEGRSRRTAECRRCSRSKTPAKSRPRPQLLQEKGPAAALIHPHSFQIQIHPFDNAFSNAILKHVLRRLGEWQPRLLHHRLPPAWSPRPGISTPLTSTTVSCLSLVAKLT